METNASREKNNYWGFANQGVKGQHSELKNCKVQKRNFNVCRLTLTIEGRQTTYKAVDKPVNTTICVLCENMQAGVGSYFDIFGSHQHTLARI